MPEIIEEICPICGERKAEIECSSCHQIVCPECTYEGVHDDVCGDCIYQDIEDNAEYGYVTTSTKLGE